MVREGRKKSGEGEKADRKSETVRNENIGKEHDTGTMGEP